MQCCLECLHGVLAKTGLRKDGRVFRNCHNRYLLVHSKRRLCELYDVEAGVIGEGGFGSVKKVKDKVTGTERVLKIMDKDSIPDVRLFQNELEFQAQCDHPHVARLFETFEDCNRVYIIMEFCEGGEILNIVERQGHVGELDAWHIFHQLLSSLIYLHTKVHLVHRDLKPENFLIKEKGAPLHQSTMKLIDFGFAQHFAPGEKSLKTKCGTPFYMAPEVLKGKYDEKCDIWSAGVILYMLLSGELPFQGEELVDIIQSARRGDLKFQEEAWEHVDDTAQDLIMELCCLDPDQRPAAIEVLNEPWLTRERAEFEKQHLNKTETQLRSSKEIAMRMKKYAHMDPFKRAALAAIGHCMQDGDVAALRATFEKLDVEGDGTISVHVLKEALCSANAGTTETEVDEMTENVAQEGCISYSDFLSSTVRRRSYLKDAYCLQAFRIFDKDGNGVIDREEYKAMVEAQNMDPQKAELAFQECDKDGDNQIDLEEFLAMMRRDERDGGEAELLSRANSPGLSGTSPAATPPCHSDDEHEQVTGG